MNQQEFSRLLNQEVASKLVKRKLYISIPYNENRRNILTIRQAAALMSAYRLGYRILGRLTETIEDGNSIVLKIVLKR